jgi:ureidoglycolate lyase
VTVLALEPLTRHAFAAFGDVIDPEGMVSFPINQGFAERFNDLANVDVGDAGGAANISIVVAKPQPRPLTLRLMERHPLGSQVFFPLQDSDWLVAVCADPRDASTFRVFRAGGRQGINYGKGVWHHPLLVLDQASRFLVVDRRGPGNNLEEVRLAAGWTINMAP